MNTKLQIKNDTATKNVLFACRRAALLGVLQLLVWQHFIVTELIVPAIHIWTQEYTPAVAEPEDVIADLIFWYIIILNKYTVDLLNDNNVPDSKH